MEKNRRLEGEGGGEREIPMEWCTLGNSRREGVLRDFMDSNWANWFGLGNLGWGVSFFENAKSRAECCREFLIGF